MMVFTLLTVNTMIVLNVVADQAISFVEQKVEASVYFKEGTSLEKVSSAASYLRTLAYVQDVRTVTAEEALERFKAQHAHDEDILASLEEVGHNPLGPTLVVKATSPEAFPSILEAVDHPQFKDDIREKDFTNFEAIIDSIKQTAANVRVFGGVLSVFFLMLAVLIVFNTVRMGIFIHREEIGIMRLVGASSSFVRAPFLVEAIVYALAAVGISAAMTIPAVSLLDPKVAIFFDTMPGGLLGFFVEHGWVIAIVQAVSLSLIAMVATGMAMRRYLRI